MWKKGGDPHTMNAAKIYGSNFWNMVKEEQKNIRAVTKNVTYAGEYVSAH